LFNAQKQIFETYFGTSLPGAEDATAAEAAADAAGEAAAEALTLDAAETLAATGAEATTGAGAEAPSTPAEGFA
jgi:hypothetical protein